ncbi:MAG: CAAX protease [Candidatus Eremiobacteraeota bacterium]|nr:CAAX protease [Candidatus Eremiobacteraeota bacterium]
MSPNAETFAPDLWATLFGVMRLHGQAFLDSVALDNGGLIAVLILLAGGLSRSLGQCFVLFANKVSAGRFAVSLVTSAVLYAIGYGLYALCTWAVARFSGVRLPLGELWIVLAVSYVPFVFSIFEALPYAGIGIMWVLRMWQLLAMVVGIAAVGRVSIGEAFVLAGLGWLGLAIGEQTIGRPLSQLGIKLMNAVTGVALEPAAASVFDDADGVSGVAPGSPQAGTTKSATGGSGASRSSTAVYIAVIVALFVLVLFVARPLQSVLLGWSAHLPLIARLPFELLWIAIVALVVGALLTPLETMGWWAGWFGETITSPPAERVSAASTHDVSRYIIYLDGISQSGSAYTADVEKFLDALEPVLPARSRFIRGLMVYSVFNRPLDDDPLFSGLWKFIDATRIAKPESILGLLINLRNIVIVGVSTDPRYGPMYNYGIASLLHGGLIANGYVPGSGVPVTLIGYSGGAQMAAGAARLLRHALEAQVDLITLGGVMSGSGWFLDLGHVYHQVGDKDNIQRLGPILFPSRWKIMSLSQWNRALRLGRITHIALGPVCHMEPGGMFDATARLPDGRTHLEQTLDNITRIVAGRFAIPMPPPKRLTNYSYYVASAWNRPEYYPPGVALQGGPYVPLAAWMGRLILPRRDERDAVRGAWLEVHHAPEGCTHLLGQRVKLRWSGDADVQRRVVAVTRDVFFSADAEYSSTTGGTVCPTRLNQWQLVDPLESLAGSRPLDDVMVMLVDAVHLDDGDDPVLRIAREPVQIAGCYYGLVRFIGPLGAERFRAVHFNAASCAFDGPQEELTVPAAVANPEHRAPSSMRDIERSPLNEQGFYIYGSPDASGAFVVRALAPRSTLAVRPGRVVAGARDGYRYVRKGAWGDLLPRKGTASSVLVRDRSDTRAEAQAKDDWAEGDRALLIHVFGGVGGQLREEAAKGPIYLGHFAYGEARVVRDALCGDLRFDITYYQVYAHNEDGLVSGAQHWSRYMGDRQFGWLGERPVCDILIRHDAFTSDFTLDDGRQASVLGTLCLHLEVMAQRYRIANGTGCAYVGPANNCAQDSNRALFATLGDVQDAVRDPKAVAAWKERFPEQVERYEHLAQLVRALQPRLQTFGGPRRDWVSNEFSMGSTLEDHPLQQVIMALGSWRMALPRFASDTIVKTFLENGAAVWVLFFDQVGGVYPEIEPIAPLTL